MTNIYALFDPRSPDVVVYVGKGLQRRAEHHWKRFLAKGTVTNVLLRRWFEKLQQDGFAPAWRFLEENVTDWQKAERDCVSTWRVMNPALCNVADGGNQWPLESSKLGGYIGGRATNATTNGRAGNGGRIAGRRTHELHPNLAKEWGLKYGAKGGRIGGPIGGRASVANGHPDKANCGGVREMSVEAKERQRVGGCIGGSIGGRRSHELHPDKAKEWGLKHGAEAGRIGGRIGAPIANHNRWHLNRNRFNPACRLCHSQQFYG